jgi:hypothetical protein
MKDFLNPPTSSTKPETLDMSGDRVMKTAIAEFPDSRLSEVELPINPTDAWQFHFSPRGVLDFGNSELVAVDRRSTRVLSARRTCRPTHRGTSDSLLTALALRELRWELHSGALDSAGSGTRFFIWNRFADVEKANRCNGHAVILKTLSFWDEAHYRRTEFLQSLHVAICSH